jgi:hypothetical protein
VTISVGEVYPKETKMQCIWKGHLGVSDPNQVVRMPRGAQIVHAAMQGKYVAIWFRCDPGQQPVERVFRVVATGQPFDDSLIYRGCCFDGAFVWHVMEVSPF